MELYKAIAECIYVTQGPALSRAVKEGREDMLDDIEDNYLPSGSGFDSGTKINREKSTENKIVIDTSFHEMDDDGYYKQWIHFSVVVTPSLLHGYTLKLSKRLPSMLKEYVLDVFYYDLSKEVHYTVADGKVTLALVEIQ